MFCKKCGANNRDGWAYCSKCGAELPKPQQQNAQPNGQYYQQAQYNNYNSGNYQQNYHPNTPPPANEAPDKGKSIASMVLGIVAAAFACGFLGIPCAIVSLALGVPAYNRAKETGRKNNMAVAGIACSCASLGVTVLFWIFWFFSVVLFTL